MGDPISISELKGTIRRVKEIGAIGGEEDEDPSPSTIEMHTGRITSTTKTDGRFPGKRYDYDANADNADTAPVGAYTIGETIWIKARGGETLVVGANYDLILVGTRLSDGIDIYVVVHPPSASSSFSGGKVYGPGTTTITTGGGGIVMDWSTEVYDTSTYWTSGQPTRLVAPETGKYLACCNINWLNLAAGIGRLLITASAGTVTSVAESTIVASAGQNIQSVAGVVPLNINEYVTVNVYQNSGVSVTLNSGVAASFSLTLLK